MTTTTVERRDVRKDQVFQVDIQIPSATTGELVAPALGAITGVVLRLSAAQFGTAIAGDVDNLSASERASTPGRFYVTVDTTLLVSRLLPLGVGARAFAIWKKAGDFDNQSVEFEIADGTAVPTG